METKCPRQLETQYLRPVDSYERQMVLRTDKCKNDIEAGNLGSFFCRDCLVTPIVRSSPSPFAQTPPPRLG